MNLRSLYLDDLTSTELEAYFKDGGMTAYIPAGAVEMHGPHMPIGTDSMIARAVSLRMAQESNGIVFPDVSYSWAGATEGFAGTISVPPELMMQLVTWICVKAHKMGFRRIVVVSIHGTNDAPLTICVRRIYETHGLIVQYLNPWRPATPEAAEVFAGKWELAKEASLVLAALDILGKSELYTEKEMAYDDPAPPLLAAATDTKFKGAVGYFYQDLRQHATPDLHTSKERGLKFVEMQVKAFVPGVLNLDKYAEQALKEKNQGCFRL